MTFGRMQVQPGMRVVETDGAPVGVVTEAAAEHFVVRRAGGGDEITLPYSAIRALLGDEVVLDTADEQTDESS